MTENEAIKRIKEQACNDRFLSINCDDSCLYGADKCEWAHAIQALEEIQQYRAIGTVEEFKALKEKNTPYKPQEYEDKYYGCKCGEVLLEKWEEYPKKLMPKSWGLPYCLGCGQKLDWQ